MYLFRYFSVICHTKLAISTACQGVGLSADGWGSCNLYILKSVLVKTLPCEDLSQTR